MTTDKQFDALIIGAGPAGLMAARELSKNNLNYMLIEAKDTIGTQLRCGEITRQNTFSELFNRTDYPFIKNSIANIAFRIKNTQKLIQKNMVMLDKPQFLRWLAQPIKDKLMLNTKLLQMNTRDNQLEVVTSRGVFYAKLAILANGANYKFQKGFDLVKTKVELIPCIGGFFKNTTLKPDTAYFYYNEEMYMASWIFPKESRIFNAGAGIILNNEKTEGLNLAKAFKQSMRIFGILLEGEPSFAGSYVTSGPIGRTYSDRLLVCGDSAGHVFAGIGEGIYFALKAGQLAGQTAINAIRNDSFHGEFLKEYEMNWKQSIGAQMDAGIILATILFFLMRHHLTLKMLKMINPKEILDIWFHGTVSLRLKLFYSVLKFFGCLPRR